MGLRSSGGGIGYGAHTAYPVRDMQVPLSDGRKAVKDVVVMTNAALSEGCGGHLQKVWIIDVTEESRPAVAATRQRDGAIVDYCARPGRVGAHASHESVIGACHGRIMFIAHFNAGVRALDIRDPYRPREIAYCVPASGGRTATPSNVEVDDRGHVYVVERHGLGMPVLELAGEARAAANLP